MEWGILELQSVNFGLKNILNAVLRVLWQVICDYLYSNRINIILAQ